MIKTSIESKVQIQDIISNQVPSFILDENPKFVDFLKQYYISQEYQSGPVDLTENLDEYLKIDNLKPEAFVVLVALQIITKNLIKKNLYLKLHLHLPTQVEIK
jgi:hypothetical protein